MSLSVNASRHTPGTYIPYSHAHDIAFTKIFSVFSPFNVAKTICSKTFSYCRRVVYYSGSSVFAFAKETTLKAYEIFMLFSYRAVRSDMSVGILSKLVDFFIKDNDYDQKNAELIAHIQEKSVNAAYFFELEKFISTYTITGLKNTFLQACEMESAARASWVNTHIVTEDDYTLLGKMLCALLERHESVIRKALAHFILKILSNLIDSVQKVQSENTFATLDLILNALNLVPNHFQECKVRERLQAAGDFQSQNLEIQNVIKFQFCKSLTAAILQIILPNGANELDLPVSKTLASYLSVGIFNQLQAKLPNTLLKGFEKVFEPDRKKDIFYQVLKLMHRIIDVEHPVIDENAIKMCYERLQELADSLYASTSAFLDYADPTVMSWLVKYIATSKLSQLTAKKMVEELERDTLQDIIVLAIKKLLPVINRGGKWVDERFEMAPIPFIKTEAEFGAVHAARLQKNARRDQKIQVLLDTIGQDPKGIVQKRASRADPENNGGIMAAIASYAQSASQNLLYNVLNLADLQGRIHRINLAILQKMGRPEHEVLIFDITKCVVTFFGYRGLFPDLHDPRLKVS